MQGAMIVHFTRAVPGRELKALEYGAEVNDYWGKLAAEGKCTPPETFFASGGGGLWLVKGELPTLGELIQTDTVKRLLAEGSLVLEGFGYEFYLTADSSDEYLATFAGLVNELTPV